MFLFEYLYKLLCFVFGDFILYVRIFVKIVVLNDNVLKKDFYIFCCLYLICGKFLKFWVWYYFLYMGVFLILKENNWVFLKVSVDRKKN